MQHEPNSPSAPRGPVESDGFFTGVQARAVILGVVVDYVATYLGLYAYFFIYFANGLAKQGGFSPEAISEYMRSPEGMMTGMAIGVLGTVAGGFAAGLKAGNRQIKHGAFVGLGSLILSFVEQQLAGGETGLTSEWIRAVSILAVIPAGASGGWLAGMLKSPSHTTAQR
jgi:hypothetical protein